MSLLTAARRLAKLLVVTQRKIVFAESCTAGLVSASLARVPGISAHHCGGVVVYRNETKTALLDIDAELLQREGAVSETIADLMAQRVLLRTPEATVAAAVTGHLGPGAPAKLDGVVFIGIALYLDDQVTISHGVHRLRLSKKFGRDARQKLAAEAVLKQAALALDFLIR